MVFRLDDTLRFPDPSLGEPDGFIAIGGDLSPQRLLKGYRLGFFPWFSFRDAPDILWYCPQERFVIFPNEVHVSHSMRTLLRKGKYQFSINKSFSEVIHHCGTVDGRYDACGAWLGPDIIEAYTTLHDMGRAASVEVWEDGNLVGGLYGVHLGRTFFGESMFSLVPNGSKMALIFLAKHLLEQQGNLIDCQFETPHLKSMGGRYITYEEYMMYVEDGYCQKRWLDMSERPSS